MKKFTEFCKELEAEIERTYTEGATLEEAERLAAKFLSAQLAVSGELKKADLDSRMRKSGVKAIRAALYLEIVSKSDKKPTEAQISALIDSDQLVTDEQLEYDRAEVDKAELERYYDIFVNSHIYFRGIAKGKFE